MAHTASGHPSEGGSPRGRRRGGRRGDTSTASAGLQAVGDVVSRFLSRRGLAGKVEAASVVIEWEELMGPQIAAVTEPLRVANGTLFVEVGTSAWMMELTLMKGELLRRMNAGKKNGKIEEIVFLMGA